MIFDAAHGVLLLAACGSAQTTDVAPPAPTTGSTQTTGLSALDLFALAARAEREHRDADAQALYDALSHDPSADIRAEARFRKAGLLALGKHYAEAAALLRAILDDMPEATRVRLELARILALLGDEEAARRALRQARASGLPPEVAVTVEQFARALRSTRRFGGSAELSFVPDSNINRATQARTLDTVIAPLTLSPDARAQTGVGVKFAGSGFIRVPLSDHWSLLPRLSGVGTVYRQTTFDDISGSAALGAELRSGLDRLTPSLGGSWRWYGGRPYARTQTISVDWLHPIGARTQILTSASIGKAEYRLNPQQDGTLYDLRLSYEHALSPKRGISVAASGERQSATDPGYATWSGDVSAFAWQEFGKTTGFVSLQGRHLESDARLFLFTDRRREWMASARIGATLRQFTLHGFAPVIRVGIERNISTVALYDYRRVFAEGGISRAF